MTNVVSAANIIMPSTEEHAELSVYGVKTNLTHLSPELLLDIAAMLPRSDLKSLRLMNRVLCGVASSNMFESIQVRDDPPSMEQLKQITRSEFWALQVRHIEWLLPTPTDMPVRPYFSPCPDLVFTPSGHMRPYLTLHCEHLQLLPSIKTVHFRGRHVDGETWFPLKAPDLYVLIMRAKIRPSVVGAGALLLELSYGPSGCIQELSINGTSNEVDDIAKPRGRYSLLTRIKSPWHESGTALNPLVFRAIAWQRKYFNPTHCTLRNFDFYDHCFWRQLIENPSLRSLTMENFTLMSYAPGPFEALMGHLKDRALNTTIPVLKVTMTNMTMEFHKGMISINNAEINDWFKDQDSHWLATKKAAFRVFTPSDSDGEDSSDDELD